MNYKWTSAQATPSILNYNSHSHSLPVSALFITSDLKGNCLFFPVLPSGGGSGEEQSRSESVSFGWTQQLRACDSLHWSTYWGLLEQVPGIKGFATCPATATMTKNWSKNVLTWMLGSSGGSADQLHTRGAAAVGRVVSQQGNKADHCWHSRSLWVSKKPGISTQVLRPSVETLF